MSESADADPGRSDPGRIATRQEFARELSSLRERAGLTVRQVAAKAGAYGAHSTLGDWFAGRGLPSTSSRDLLVRVLEVCGVADPAEAGAWLAAWRRVRRAPGRRVAGPEPYRGLAAFQPEDAGWFFGRRALTGRLLEQVAGMRAAGGGVRLVVGPSGSGKSSLLRAGVVAALRDGALPDSAHWPVIVTVPGARPVAELAARLAALADVPAGEIAAVVREDPGAAARYVGRAGVGDRPLVLVVDQFEEVFTECGDEAERRGFIAAVRAAAAPPGGALVLLGLRADFYAAALRHSELVALAQDGQLAVGPMEEAELREAIVEPARRAGVEIEDGLVELLLRQVAPSGGVAAGGGAHEVGVLPLLSHALYTTWRQGQGRSLTVAAYHAVGGIEGAVAASADAVHDGLIGRRRELARRLFLHLVHVAPDAADTRRRATVAELLDGGDGEEAAEMEEVLDRFVARRLITAGADTVEISHEALLRAWPLLRSWVDADRAGLVVARRLTADAAAWIRLHRDPDALYRGGRLVAAQEWAAGYGERLPADAREFLEASVRQSRRRTRRLHQAVATLAALLVVALVASGVAVRAQRAAADAERTATYQRDQALSRKTATDSGALRVTDPGLAAQLALAAYRLFPTAEARGGLLSAVAGMPATLLTGHENAVYGAAFQPGGRLLATASTDQTTRLWDVRRPHRPQTLAVLRGHLGAVLAVAFAPGGRVLATAGDDRTARLWDVADPRAPHPLAVLTGHSQGIRHVSFSPSGRTLATAGHDGVPRLWDVSDPSRPHLAAELPVEPGTMTTAVFAPAADVLATAGPGNTARLWDVADPRRPRRLADLEGHTAAILAARFSPDGRTLATAGFDNTVRLWDVAHPREPKPIGTLTGHTNGVAALAFSPDGRRLASGGYDMTVRLWDLQRPASIPLTLTGHADTVLTAEFQPTGETLATTSRDGSIRLWDLRAPLIGGQDGTVYTVAISPDARTLVTGADRTARLWSLAPGRPPTPRAVLVGHTDGIVRAVWRPDGKVLATASLDFTVRLWQARDGGRAGPLSTIKAHTDNVYSAAFDPSGRTLATVGADRTLRTWDVADPRHPRLLATVTGHGDTILAVAFSPDGRTLATGSADRTIRLWDVTDTRHPAVTATLTGHRNAVNDVAFSPDGRRLSSAGADGLVLLHDIAARPARRPPVPLTGHTSAVAAVTFHPGGRLLASAGFDGTVRLWDLTRAGQPDATVTLSGHTDRVYAAAFSPDGRTLATGGVDATVRLWETDVGRAARQACALAYPVISPAEWARRMPGLPYRPPCP
ncbi:helix-turn-helix domain-containing protein [Nonomuraea sp. NPDC052129]|uniref:nSTAND1 domain-containing NTPase n=1 Tax=Nonomuraea sp. NPDC052129 TaxID=3154651 RepID=UPI003438AADB